MIILLSPAKSLDFSPAEIKAKSSPRFMDQTKELVGIMKKKSAREISKLMSISDKLGTLNKDRFDSFSDMPSAGQVKQAILAFKGDVYVGIDNDTLSENDLKWSQDHVRILSGLYGVLRPLDLIQPYRLEMGTKLKNAQGKDLYAFWGATLTNSINSELKKSGSDVIINLASNEYFGALQSNDLKGTLLNVNFLEKRNGEYKFFSFTAKKARGWMCRFLIDKRATDPEQMKHFKGEGFKFNKSLSSGQEFVFTRAQR